MKKKRLYEKPSTEVVMLQQQTQLLAGSTGSVDNPDPFGVGGDPLNPSSPSRMDDELEMLMP